MLAHNFVTSPWRVSNSDIPDSVAAQLDEWGIG